MGSRSLTLFSGQLSLHLLYISGLHSFQVHLKQLPSASHSRMNTSRTWSPWLGKTFSQQRHECKNWLFPSTQKPLYGYSFTVIHTPNLAHGLPPASQITSHFPPVKANRSLSCSLLNLVLSVVSFVVNMLKVTFMNPFCMTIVKCHFSPGVLWNLQLQINFSFTKSAPFSLDLTISVFCSWIILYIYVYFLFFSWESGRVF